MSPAERLLFVLCLVGSIAFGALILGQAGCAGDGKEPNSLGDWFRDWQASVGVEACADAKVTFGADGVDFDWTAEACAGAAVKGIDVLEFCAEFGDQSNGQGMLDGSHAPVEGGGYVLTGHFR